MIKMRKDIAFKIIAIMLTLQTLAGCGGAGGDGVARRIVVFHSWSPEDETYEGESFDKLMRDELAGEGIEAEIHHVFVDAMHYPTNFQEQTMQTALDSCRMEWHPELILVNDDPVMEWLLTHRDTDSLLKTTPIVFAGVSTMLHDSLTIYDNMTGYEEQIEIGRNVEMLCHVTGATEITIELDHTPFDERIRQKINEDLQASLRYIDNSDFHIDMGRGETGMSHGMTTVNIVSCAQPESNRGPADSAEVGKRHYLDAVMAAEKTRHLQVKRDIFSNTLIDQARTPQFTCIREGFRPERGLHKFVGGYFTDLPSQIADQVHYAARILRGERPSEMPRTLHTPKHYMDYDAMRAMGLRYSEYSGMYTIVGAPFMVRHPLLNTVLVVGGILLTMVAMVMLALMIYRWRRRSLQAIIEERRQEEKMHDLLFSSTNDTLWYFRNGLLHLTETFSEAFGLPSPVLSPLLIKEMVHPDSMAALSQLLDFRNQRGKKNIRLHVSPDNGRNWYWIEISYTATEHSALTGELYGILLNVDRKKRCEDMLQRARQKASELELKENFLANISHDLRTPLSAITGFSDILASNEVNMQPQEREDIRMQIHKNTEMILRMIDGVVQRAEVEIGDLQLCMAPTSVQTIVRESYLSNKVIAPSHLSFSIRQSEPDAIVNMDPTRMKQVLNNLLSNAFKFTIEGGVTLGWSLAPDDPDIVELYVEDTGIGITPSVQGRIFERFAKENESDRGTGLGLSISKKIVEAQEGQVGVTSEIGKGSRFYVRMKRCLETIIVGIITGAMAASCSVDAKQDGPAERSYSVIVAHSYDRGFKNYEEFDDEIRATLAEDHINAEITDVYLNLQDPTATGRDIFTGAIDSLRGTGRGADLILTEGDRTAHDIFNYAEEIEDFDSVHIVLGALHHPEWENIRGHQKIVGIADPYDYCTNINLAVELSGSNVVEIELDFFHQDSIIRSELREAINRPPYVDNTDFHIDAIRESDAQGAWRDSILVFAISAESPELNSSKPLTPQDGHRRLQRIYTNAWRYASLAVKKDLFSKSIVDKSGKPQFSLMKAGFADGDAHFLAGYFAGYRDVAHDIAHTGAMLLRGADARNLSGQKHQKQFYMDYKAMKMLGMDYSDYSDRFIIVGAPFRVAHQYLFNGAIVVCIMLGLLCLFGGVILILHWKENGEKRVLADVMHKAELRQLALHGAYSRPVTGEEDIVSTLATVEPGHSVVVTRVTKALDVVGSHRFDLYADADKTGTYRWWQLRFAVNYDRRGVKRTNGILIDIDDSKRKEAEMQKAMKLAEEAQRKETFLNTISHEIRTPLNAVVGFSDVLASSPLETFDRDELRLLTTTIKMNNMKLTSLIDDILMFSRLESGRMKFVMETITIKELMQQVSDMWRGNIPDGIDFSIHTSRPDLRVTADGQRAFYIVNQLIGNAIKFTNRGTISVDVACHYNDDEIEISVTDTGCGLARDKYGVAFDMFWKDNKFIPGLGLGLGLARRLADGMGGRLSVESREDDGSRFSLTLKRAVG